MPSSVLRCDKKRGLNKLRHELFTATCIMHLHLFITRAFLPASSLVKVFDNFTCRIFFFTTVFEPEVRVAHKTWRFLPVKHITLNQLINAASLRDMSAMHLVPFSSFFSWQIWKLPSDRKQFKLLKFQFRILIWSTRHVARIRFMFLKPLRYSNKSVVVWLPKYVRTWTRRFIKTKVTSKKLDEEN